MNLPLFITNIRQILTQINQDTFAQTTYVNLAECCDQAELRDWFNHDTPPADPLIDAFHLILEAAAKSQVDLIKYGVNEICKSYLQLVTLENEKIISIYYFKRLELIFQRCLMRDFPYPNEVWNYLGGCINTVGLFLLEQQLQLGTKELLQTFYHMGKSAALRGLQTASTQGYFRVLENKALEKGFEGIAASAKNFRFNLELY